MAISIDTVYQKVLTFANKEQRGYITPQEFNLYADQAQKEIFEQYFYDLNQFSRIPGNSSEYSDIKHNINEKIAAFEKTGNGTTLPSGIDDALRLHRLGTVICDGYEVEEVQQNELLHMNQSYLTAPSKKRKVYVRTGESSIAVYPPADGVTYTYVAVPTKPSWSYVVINKRAMYDASNKVNFQLHPSEESELVYKILKFAGISMSRLDLMRAGQIQEQSQVQQEKQ